LPSKRTADPLILLYAIWPKLIISYIQGLPVIFGWIIDLDGLGSFLVGWVPSKDVDLAFEDEREPSRAGVAHGREISPFFWLFRQESTLFDAVLLAWGQQLVLLIPPPKDVDVAQPTRLEKCTHMRISLLLHARHFLELVTHQTVPLLSARHGLALNRRQPEQESLLWEILKSEVDSPAEEDRIVGDESDEHEVVGRVGVIVEQVGSKHLLRFLEDDVLGLVLAGRGGDLSLRG